MSKRMPIFYGAMMLTAVNLLLRFVSTSFQVYLSATIGAEGVGLLQLIFSVNALAMTAGMAGIRTAAMYITAEELGRKQQSEIPWILSGCFLHAVVTGAAVSLALYFSAPWIAAHWIGSEQAVGGLRIFAAFLPISCLCGVMTGYFTAANRIGTLAAVEIAEQICSMGITVLILMTLPVGDSAGACQAVILGSCCGSLLTFLALLVIHLHQHLIRGPRVPIARRLCAVSVPLALADNLKAGISSLENLMVPRRLGLFPGISNPVAVFGILTGMVFPVMMFPASILYSLAELLIPELARCAAVRSTARIQYLIRRNLRMTLLYGLFCGSFLYLYADLLCLWLFPGIPAAGKLRCFSVLVPMLYCDLIVDAMTKGLGQQRACVRYNILSNSLDVVLLFFLLPRFGFAGYFASFALTHILNFCLSIRRLLRIGKIRLNPAFPCFAVAAALLAAFSGMQFSGAIRPVLALCGMFFCLLYFFGVLTLDDLRWLKSLIKPQKAEKLPE